MAIQQGAQIVYGNGEPVARKKRRLKDLVHPEWGDWAEDWARWRLVYEGGRRFKFHYLKSWKHESPEDFAKRMALSPVPAFAKAAVNEVKDALFQRLGDVIRRNGGDVWNEAILGNGRGVDRAGSSLDDFIATKILPELLSMRKVAVWVDNGVITHQLTLADQAPTPYLSVYRAEDIRNWTWTDDVPGEFESVILSDGGFRYDPDYNFPLRRKEVYRWASVVRDEAGNVTGVHVALEDEEGNYVETTLGLTKVPLILFQLKDSLLKDIDFHQIALLNAESGDVSWVNRAAFPVYVEQFDSKDTSEYFRPKQPEKPNLRADLTPGGSPKAGQAAEATKAKPNETVLGISNSRKYPIGTEAPSFISPSPEPLQASMAKQDQLKVSIRQLARLAVAGGAPEDWRALDNGLASIGLELERGDRKIAEAWAAYTQQAVPTIKYPRVWSMLSDEERQAAVASLKASMSTVPSKKARIEILKEMARLLVGHKLNAEEMEEVEKDIQNSPWPTGDPADITLDVENGLVSLATASQARGWKDGEAKAAEDDHMRRLDRIATSQTAGAAASAPGKPINGDPAARGLNDLSANPKAGAQEKVAANDTTASGDNVDATRGNGRLK